MINWWEALTTLQRVFAIMAVPATLLLLLQTALLLIGLGGEGDGGDGIDIDGDGIADGLDGIDLDGDGIADVFDNCGPLGHAYDPGHDHGKITFLDHNRDGTHDHSLRILSLRTVVAFFAIFGWAGIVLTKSGLHEIIACVLAFFSGGAAMLLLAWMLKLILDMQAQGNIDPRNAIGRQGIVYLPIPPGRSGTGKVTVLIQGRYRELDAVTDHAAPLATGTSVTVYEALEESVLAVRPTEETNIILGGT